ncbi:ATP-dependent helicase HrpB [Mesorhizobium sp. RP14(2022)]|uniref:ATP-dependent helicase HrpB n=1 Tax=Mesorhizobium liriopis TaxID=2953882 RepID=A0ABT1C7H7_9HYPH|nr:ATP-dependent helicase HrpB [Mesorhizobium liriopis]MCO6050438.1 ATP-dependent helicase HrpB [Mesorhizobium liriopis]
MTLPDLPVRAILPDLLQTLEARPNAVLVAPPGAGKTTLVPLALLDAPWAAGKRILLLEPRRLAARAAATRMAELLGEEPGGRVGYAMRMESRVSDRTRILVVTEGVLARAILDDPELTGIAAVLFDEFHERSLDGDFGLALALDVQDALRPDLRLLAMSATLDGARVSQLMGGAPVLESQGRSFPVEIRYRERGPDERVEDAMATAIRAMMADEPGSLLAFLPGQREIERTAERLEGRLAPNIEIMPLYGALEPQAQRRAVAPAKDGARKVVLATSIAETSLTIDGVRVVVDSGLSRVPRYEPNTGLTRLETVRASRASADQRAGRAGRTAPGVALRLWRAEQTAALPAFSRPEILEADLSGLVLDCAAFGVADPSTLRFLDPPPRPALNEAQSLLRDLGALDADNRLSPYGDAMRRVALPARLAAMVVEAPTAERLAAARLAVLLSERGLGGNETDLDARLSRFANERGPRADAARKLAARIARQAGGGGDESARAGPLLLHAWPDRVAKARGGRGRFVLANGRGAAIDEAHALAGAPFLVVADLQGEAREARIAAAAALSEDDIRAVMGDRIERSTVSAFDLSTRSLRISERVRLGAITLADRPLPRPKGEEADRAVLDALREHGLDLLRPAPAAQSLRERLGWLHREFGAPWPDVSDTALHDGLDLWLAPFLSGEASLSAIEGEPLYQALLGLVPHEFARRLNDWAPTHWDAPSGSRVAVLYDGEHPRIALRVQELFGLDRHPSIAGGQVPLTLELLSPAHRPIQTTRDLPRFWRGSWADVRADLRGRYPKHPWPEDPLSAPPTARAKPRGT